MELINGKYRTQLKCMLCGEKFGDFSVMQSASILPICDKCRKTRKRLKSRK